MNFVTFIYNKVFLLNAFLTLAFYCYASLCILQKKDPILRTLPIIILFQKKSCFTRKYGNCALYCLIIDTKTHILPLFF